MLTPTAPLTTSTRPSSSRSWRSSRRSPCPATTGRGRSSSGSRVRGSALPGRRAGRGWRPRDDRRDLRRHPDARHLHQTALHEQGRLPRRDLSVVSSIVTGDPAIIYRAILIAAFLLVTTPISALVIARAAFLRGEKMQTPDARDESGRGLAGGT